MASQRAQRGIPVSGYTRHPGSDWIDAHRADLPENMWVAANGKGCIANDASIDGLMDKLRAKQVDPASVAIAFITPDSA